MEVLYVKGKGRKVKKFRRRAGSGFNKIFKSRGVLGFIVSVAGFFLGFHLVAIKDRRVFDNHLYNGKVLVGAKSALSMCIPLFSCKFRGSNLRLHLVLFKISSKCLLDCDIHNPIKVQYEIYQNEHIEVPLRFNWILYKLTKMQFIGSIVIDKKSNRTVFVRTSIDGRYFLTVREINSTDYFFEKVKIFIAFILFNVFYLFIKRSVLLFEKKSNRYEESASVLFEEMVTENINNVFYILDKNKIEQEVPPEFQIYAIAKNSIRHYFHFFNSDLFITTEAPGHGIDLRVANFFAVNKLSRKNYKYVFLQHGVMYMVSLSAKLRKAVRYGGVYPNDVKIVVSSIEEAKHFIEDGGYYANNLYITGLPKFDRLQWEEHARDIVIMPTWRPWEYNEISQNCESTGYYKMIAEIIESIPMEEVSRIRLLPHPLFYDSFAGTSLEKFIVKNESYDKVLRRSSILITDYSSIAFDMFGRGGKVIFWWKDKIECMEHYGGELKLNSRNCFGDIVYNKSDFISAFNKADESKERPCFQEKNYNSLVFDFKGRSSRKLIERLIEDGYISKK
ncbi:CDP-glycerol glycerophosphotransferase family protein [Cobetia crustatorum]|nr:CDP-glycerol glycerophosphotransferase family protein [Cobetia crustatorum]